MDYTTTETDKLDQCTIRCPVCDRVMMKAVLVIDGVIKCEKCHRRYQFNVNDGSISVELISQPKNKNEGNT